MITKFNHVAIAVANLDEAINLYKNILGGKVSKIHDYPNHGVSVSQSYKSIWKLLNHSKSI